MGSKKAILIVDGLPSSSKADLFVKKFSSRFDFFYISFASDLRDINCKSMSEIIKKNIQNILSSYPSFSIIAISFGGYVIAHSNDTLSPYSSVIEKITLYSPVARMKRVVGIETLPEYLSERYPDLNISIKNLFRMDHEMPTINLLDGDLAGVVRVVLGSKDSQLPVDFQEEYFRRYDTVITNEGHIGLSSLIDRGGPEWM